LGDWYAALSLPGGAPPPPDPPVKEAQPYLLRKLKVEEGRRRRRKLKVEEGEEGEEGSKLQKNALKRNCQIRDPELGTFVTLLSFDLQR